MSDLTATNCGCGCEDRCDNGCGNNRSIFGGNNCCSIIWILILLSIFGNGNWGTWGNNNGCDNGCGNSCWLIILLLLFCCGDNGCGSFF